MTQQVTLYHACHLIRKRSSATAETSGDTYMCLSTRLAPKTVLLGETAVGKSSIAVRFVRDQFFEYQESTIGAAFLAQSLTLPGTQEVVRFEIWDTAGQERYHSLAPMYYRGAKAALVVYDITDAKSFEKATLWVNELQQQCLPWPPAT